MSARDLFSPGTGQVDPNERVLMPCTRNADGSITTHPERMVVTPVDECLLQLIARGDKFANHTCVACGFHAALFVIAGRFGSLCPFCTVGRIEEYRAIGADPVEPGWVTLLYQEARKEAAYQARKEDEAYTVSLDDVWTCARCGAFMQPRDARYYHAPGVNTSPPYCGPCADALRAGAGSGS